MKIPLNLVQKIALVALFNAFAFLVALPVFALAASAPYPLNCEHFSEDDELCSYLETDATTAMASPARPSQAVPATSSTFIMADRPSLTGGELSLENEFNFNTVLGDATVLPYDKSASKTLALVQSGKIQSEIRKVEDYLRNEWPGTRDVRVSISSKK